MKTEQTFAEDSNALETTKQMDLELKLFHFAVSKDKNKL